MRNFLKKATLGVALGAAALTAAAPAEAQRWRGYRHHDSTGPAIIAGVAGLAIGAAIASGNNRDRYERDRYYDNGYSRDQYYYDRGGYDRGYYDRGYDDRRYYDEPRRGYYGNRCVSRLEYDPYIGRRVLVRYC